MFAFKLCCSFPAHTFILLEVQMIDCNMLTRRNSDSCYWPFPLYFHFLFRKGSICHQTAIIVCYINSMLPDTVFFSIQWHLDVKNNVEFFMNNKTLNLNDSVHIHTCLIRLLSFRLVVSSRSVNLCHHCQVYVHKPRITSIASNGVNIKYIVIFKPASHYIFFHRFSVSDLANWWFQNEIGHITLLQFQYSNKISVPK